MIDLTQLREAMREANEQWTGDIEPLLRDLGIEPEAAVAIARAATSDLMQTDAPVRSLIGMAFLSGMQLGARAVRREGGRG